MLAAASSDGNLSVHTCNVDTGEWSVALVQNEGNLPAHPLGATCVAFAPALEAGALTSSRTRQVRHLCGAHCRCKLSRHNLACSGLLARAYFGLAASTAFTTKLKALAQIGLTLAQAAWIQLCLLRPTITLVHVCREPWRQTPYTLVYEYNR